MQTLESLKSKGQTSFTNLMASVKERPDEVKLWGVAAGSAVVGAVAVNAAARGVIAILAALASPPVAVAVGAVGGGYLGWNYLNKWQATPEEGRAAAEAVVETISVTAAESSASLVAEPIVVAPPVDESQLPPPAESATASAEAAAAETMAAPTPEAPSELPPVPPTPAVPAPAVSDDLEVINGIGPVYAGRLQSAGIQTLAQLAELSPEQIREIIGTARSGHMIEPEQWIAEARQLVAGGKDQ